MKSNPLSLEEVSERLMRFICHCLKINFGMTAIYDLAPKNTQTCEENQESRFSL